jgi:hypothetical protein
MAALYFGFRVEIRVLGSASAFGHLLLRITLAHALMERKIQRMSAIDFVFL